MKRPTILLVAVCVLLATAWLGGRIDGLDFPPGQEAGQSVPPPAQAAGDGAALGPADWAGGVPGRAASAKVTRIVDGDTIGVRYDDGREETIRLLLIDTPETKHPDEPVQCYGPEATRDVTSIIPAGTRVFLQGDIEDRDRYGRQLRYVWLKLDGKAYLVNKSIVHFGYGVRSIYPPNVKYVDEIGDAQRHARTNGLGLWGACGDWGSNESE